MYGYVTIWTLPIGVYSCKFKNIANKATESREFGNCL